MFLFAPIRWAIRLFSLVVLVAVAWVVYNAVDVVRAAQPPTVVIPSGGDAAIIVLGPAPVGGSLSTDDADRLATALDLYREGAAPRIVVTCPGGAAGSDSVEERWLDSHGVRADAITAEGCTSTASSLSQAAEIAGAGARVVVVTDAIDTLYSMDAAHHAGLVAQVAAPSQSERLFVFELAPLFREATAVAAGRLIGVGNTPWAAVTVASRGSPTA